MTEASAEEAAEIEAFMAELDGRPSLRPPSRGRSVSGGMAGSILSRKEEVTEEMRRLRGSVLGVEGLPPGAGGPFGSGAGSRASPSPPTHLGSSPRLMSLRRQGSALSIREEAEGGVGSEASTAVPAARRGSSHAAEPASRPSSVAGFAPYAPSTRARTPSNMPAGPSVPALLGSSPLPLGIPNARMRQFEVPPADSPRPALLSTAGSVTSLEQSGVGPAELEEAVGRLELGDSEVHDQLLEPMQGGGAVNPALVPLPEDRGRGASGGWSGPGSREQTPGSGRARGGGGELPFARGARAGAWGMEFDG